ILIGPNVDPNVAAIFNSWWDFTLAIPGVAMGQAAGGGGGDLMWIPGVTDNRPLPQTGYTFRPTLVTPSSGSTFGSGAVAPVGECPRGTIMNGSSRVMLVAASGRMHRLRPCFKSPVGVDADGVRSEDRTPISDHVSWWKVRGTFVAHVDDRNDG